MTGRRRRAEDALADQRPGRRGKHSAPPDPPSVPPDPYSRPGGAAQGVPPPASPPDSGPLPRVRRSGDPYPRSGDPYPPSGGRYPASGDPYPPPGGRPPGGGYPPAGNRYPGPADDRGAPGGYAPPGGYGSRDDRRDRAGPGPGRGPGGSVLWDEPGSRARDDDNLAAGRDGWDFGQGADDRPARPRRRRGRWAALIAVLGILAILVPLAVGGFYAYRVISAHFFPADYSGDGTGQVIVQIRPGDPATTVGDRLSALGVVASSRAFVNAAEHSSKGSALEPGFYRLHKHMSATLAFNLLLKPSSRVQLKVTVPEGWRVSQTAAALGHNSGIPASDYRQALRNTAALGLPSYAHGNPEGYLFPATYEIQPGMTATDVLRAMVKAFNHEAASINLTRAAAQRHLTPREAIVVASLAQAEGGKVADFPKITRVVYNRLAAGMPLQLDSTVLYALHTYGILATDRQLNARSPYNTYKYKGLPPGPIDSPGDAAIRAALHPAKGNWLYFVTVNPKTRKTVFTSSQAVFNQLRAELQRNLGQGG